MPDTRHDRNMGYGNNSTNTFIIFNTNNETGRTVVCVCVCLENVFPRDFQLAMDDYCSTGG